MRMQPWHYCKNDLEKWSEKMIWKIKFKLWTEFEPTTFVLLLQCSTNRAIKATWERSCRVQPSMFSGRNTRLSGLPPLKTTIFQGCYSRAAHRRAHGMMWFGPNPPYKRPQTQQIKHASDTSDTYLLIAYQSLSRILFRSLFEFEE